MKLHFYGADRCVTGSCHCLEINGKKILVDCGLQQGRDELDNRYLAFAPGSIDILLVTHAHIDHTGRIPLLVKNGFHGRILTTRVTADLMKIMLLDSAHIQESDAEYENRKGERAGREPVEPLYTEQDALDVFKYVTTCEYEEKINLCEGVSAVFTDAGHLLGSASITLELEENGVHKTLVFSGDIGNVDQPIIRDPQLLKKADYVVMESTYGDRNHTEVWSYTDELAEIIDETLGKGGNVVIPSFAVGRTQELLYFIREIKDQKLVKSTPNFPVYIDSPLAKAATTVFCGDLHGYLDEQALDLVKDGTHMFTFPNLNLVESSEESKMLNMDTTPKVIISASGMCDAGRIRHHLKHNLWRANSAVVFVGFHAGPQTARRRGEGQTLWRGDRRQGEDRQLPRPFLPRRPRPPHRVDQGLRPEACACVRRPRRRGRCARVCRRAQFPQLPCARGQVYRVLRPCRKRNGQRGLYFRAQAHGAEVPRGQSLCKACLGGRVAAGACQALQGKTQQGYFRVHGPDHQSDRAFPRLIVYIKKAASRTSAKRLF